MGRVCVYVFVCAYFVCFAGGCAGGPATPAAPSLRGPCCCAVAAVGAGEAPPGELIMDGARSVARSGWRRERAGEGQTKRKRKEEGGVRRKDGWLSSGPCAATGARSGGISAVTRCSSVLGWPELRRRARRRRRRGGGGVLSASPFLERLRERQGVLGQRGGLVWGALPRAQADRRRRGGRGVLSASPFFGTPAWRAGRCGAACWAGLGFAFARSGG